MATEFTGWSGDVDPTVVYAVVDRHFKMKPKRVTGLRQARTQRDKLNEEWFTAQDLPVPPNPNDWRFCLNRVGVE
jgi:hypothetical protein